MGIYGMFKYMGHMHIIIVIGLMFIITSILDGVGKLIKRIRR